MKMNPVSPENSSASVSPSPCDICQNDINQGDEALMCDSCLQWVCISCIDEQKKGSCTKKLYHQLAELDDSEFQWDCPKCANMSLPEQLVNCELYTQKRLVMLGVSPLCFVVNSQPDAGDRNSESNESAQFSRKEEESHRGFGEEIVQENCIQTKSKNNKANSETSLAQVVLQLIKSQHLKDEKDREERLKEKQQERDFQQQERQKERDFQQQLISTLLSGQQKENYSQETKKPPAIFSRIPKTDLLTFNGTISEWPAFWESFDLNVNSQPDLEDAQKLDLLNRSLRGSAQNKIRGLGLEAANYQEAIRILKKEYARPDEMKEAQVRKLLQVSPVRNDLSNLEDFIDTIQMASSSLKRLNVSVSMIDAYVVSLHDKLPKTIQMKVKEKRLEKQEVVDFCSMEEFLKILDFIKRTQVCTYETQKDNIPNQKFEVGENRQKYKSNPPPTAFLYGTSTKNRTKLPCAFCESVAHLTLDCSVVKDVESRKRAAERKGKCGRCLGAHDTFQCRTKIKCFSCGISGHHGAFCFKRIKPNLTVQTKGKHQNTESGESSTERKKTEVQIHLAGPNEEDGIVMSTFSTEARNKINENVRNVNVYMDTGAKCTCIDRDTALQLKLPSKGEVLLETARFNSNTLEKINAEIVELELLGENGYKIKMNAYSIPNMTPALTICPLKFKSETWKKIQRYHPKNCPPNKKLNMKIDILVGMDYWYQIMGPAASKIIHIDSNLFIHCSPMGNILAGNYMKSGHRTKNEVHMMLNNIQKHDISNPWKLESIGINEKENENLKERELLQYFEETTQYEKGRYYVRWPWKTANPQIATNFGVAKCRLSHTLNTLLRTSKKFENVEEYDKILKNQLENEIIEPVISKEPDGPVVHYIPHFPHIKQDRATTKVRIVYDASAKTKPHGTSLNDLLYVGKNYLEDLTGILMRFRMTKIAITADIEKAFLQVGLQVKDRDCTRFLWLKDPTHFSLENNIQIYRFKRIPFGIVSSPYLLGATIDHHLRMYSGTLSERIQKNIYMDNVFLSAETAEEGIEVYHECKELFYKASMNLREWQSNDQNFMASIPEIDKAKGEKVKVLGLQWDLSNDMIYVKSAVEDSDSKPETKRTLLKTVAQVFDPLGLIAPMTIKSKVKIQELWKQGFDWDTELSPEHRKEWVNLKKILSEIPKVTLPRNILLDSNEPISLLCFADASEAAYAAAIYLYQSVGNKSECNLIFSKARVSPIKPLLTIPRLELLAVLIGTRALRFVENQLGKPAEKKILWTDSKIVLGWLETRKTLEPYVHRRVEEIKDKEDIEFRYIRTKDNPVDIATRGASYEALVNSTWFKGPKWILDEASPWNSVMFVSSESKNIQENSDNMQNNIQTRLKTDVTKNLVQRERKSPGGLQLDSYTSMQELMRETVIRQRIHNSNDTTKDSCELPPSAQEIKEARMQWIQYVQHKELDYCFKELSEGTLSQLTSQLDLYIENEIIRCGGRIANAKIKRDAKFPILLPKNHHFTRLIIMEAHEKVLHSGPRITLAEVRKRFWIPQGLSQTQKALKSCLICRRVEGGAFRRPKMGLIPAERLCRSQAFQFVGMDYLGPLYIRIPGKATAVAKRWISIFTCFATRAVHLELVTDCSATSAINAVTRFISRRGSPECILSDNAPQFKSVADHLKRIWGNRIENDEYKHLVTFFAEKEIEWRTIPEGAPWVGGFYERLVGLIKRTIRKVLWNATVNEEHLSTLIAEIESILNSRPLLVLSTEFGDGDVLTPANFIAPSSRLGMLLPLENFSDQNYTSRKNTNVEQTLKKQWKHGQMMLDHFWKIWQNQYLLQLRESHRMEFKRKPGDVQREPITGEIVLVKSRTPRMTWKLAVIKNLLRAKDGRIRFVEICLPNGKVSRRSVGDLVPLETQIGEKDGQVSVHLLHLNYSEGKQKYDPGQNCQQNGPNPAIAVPEPGLIQSSKQDMESMEILDKQIKNVCNAVVPISTNEMGTFLFI